MEIVFLGTGGGRINLILQKRATGGFRINSPGASIHVDPGPGALVHSVRLKQNPLHLDAVIVTHYHIDHVSDAAVMIEGMSQHTLQKAGILIGSKNTLLGDAKGDRCITSYHQDLAGEVVVAQWGEKRTFKTKKGGFDIEFIQAKHDEETAFGFKLKLDGKTIGYTSDTEYYAGLGEAYRGCDLLVVNCLKPDVDAFHGHLTTKTAGQLIGIARPKQAVLSHLGMNMIRGDPETEAKKIEKETGVKTVAATDWVRISLD